METKKEFTGLKDLLNFSTIDFQTMVTGFYVSIVFIGMIFNYTKYRILNINIFEHSDIVDFLISPLGDPMIILLTVLNFVLLHLFMKLDQWILKKHPAFYKKLWLGANEKTWFQSFYKLQWVIFIPVYLYLLSDLYAIHQKKKLLKKKADTEINFIDGTNFSGKKIGANNSFYFMLQDSATVKIIPTSSIKTITKKRRISKKKID